MFGRVNHRKPLPDQEGQEDARERPATEFCLKAKAEELLAGSWPILQVPKNPWIRIQFAVDFQKPAQRGLLFRETGAEGIRGAARMSVVGR